MTKDAEMEDVPETWIALYYMQILLDLALKTMEVLIYFMKFQLLTWTNIYIRIILG